MSDKKKKLEKLRKELKALQIKAQPLNTAIYLKECEIYELTEDLKEMGVDVYGSL